MENTNVYDVVWPSTPTTVQGAKLAKAARDMRNRQKAYFKHRGDMLLAEAKNAEADVDRLLADIFPVPKQGQLL